MKQTFLEKNKHVDEDVVDRLERMLRSKFELKTGFAEPGQLSRTMHKALRALDTDDSEDLDPKRFATIMKKLNCGEDRAAVDALFHRYDVKDRGFVSMKEFSDAVFGIKTIARSNPECRNVIDQVRQKLLARGENGYRGLVRILRRMDDNGNRNLEPQELADGLAVYGLHLSKQELATLFKYFDADGNGHISITEFMAGLRPNISPARLALVKMAFLRLDRINPDGTVTLQELGQMYKADKHPAVLEGSKTEEEVIREFNDAWDKNGDEVITEDEFIKYYKDLSASIDNDQYFELMIRNAWHISGGEGAAQNTSCRRVLVTYKDGHQTIEEIKNDLGIRADDKEKMKKALEAQGCKDIVKIDLYS